MLKQVRCPSCQRLTPWEESPHRPFCSERCRLLDLGNWANERYRISGPPAEAPPQEPAETDDDETE